VTIDGLPAVFALGVLLAQVGALLVVVSFVEGGEMIDGRRGEQRLVGLVCVVVGVLLMLAA
jgi:hypothetical protein